MNRREHLAALLGTLGAACGADDRRADPAPAAAHVPSGESGVLPGVRVVTDFADRVRGRGTDRENWGPAFEAAWNSAAEVGTDVFVPAGTYPLRLREGRGGYGPALDLVQTGKYRPVRLLGATRGAVLRVQEWPAAAPVGTELIRVRSGIRTAAGALDVATGAEIANVSIENRDASATSPGWRTEHDFPGVALRLVGVYGGGVSNCLFRGFGTGLVLGGHRTEEASYLCGIHRNRFQYCNRAVVLPPTSNGHTIRENHLLWFSQPRSGAVAAFETSHSTTSVFFCENSAEQLAGWMYGIGATTNARICGGRIESVHGVVRVHGTGDFPARGTQIQGLSIDCDSLRAPAISLERSEGALVSGITFYQSRTPHPHVLLHPASAATTMFAVGSDGESALRVVDRSRGLSWLGAPA